MTASAVRQTRLMYPDPFDEDLKWDNGCARDPREVIVACLVVEMHLERGKCKACLSIEHAELQPGYIFSVAHNDYWLNGTEIEW